MREEDQPPQRIWLNDEELADHFERIRAKYASKDDTEAVPQAPLEQNELTRGLRG